MRLRLRLVSSKYSWVKGDLLVVGPIEGYDEPAEDHCMKEVSIEDNEATLDISKPAIYGLRMMDVSAVGIHDGQHISISVIPLADVEITSADLLAGIKEIVIKPLGTLHVTVVDEGEHRPVAGAAVSFFFEESSGTDTVYCDENGNHTFWALPYGHYHIATNRGSSVKVEIVANRETTITLIRPTTQ